MQQGGLVSSGKATRAHSMARERCHPSFLRLPPLRPVQASLPAAKQGAAPLPRCVSAPPLCICLAAPLYICLAACPTPSPSSLIQILVAARPVPSSMVSP